MKRLLSLLIPFSLTLALCVTVVAQDASPRTAQITAAYTDKARYDVYEADASAGAFTLTLIAPSKRRTVVVIKTDSSANAVTVATAGTGATINGQSSFVLRSERDAATFVANGRSGSSGVWRASASNRRLNLLSPDKTIATKAIRISWSSHPKAEVWLPSITQGRTHWPRVIPTSSRSRLRTLVRTDQVPLPCWLPATRIPPKPPGDLQSPLAPNERSHFTAQQPTSWLPPAIVCA
jgi:hypothetical protein